SSCMACLLFTAWRFITSAQSFMTWAISSSVDIQLDEPIFWESVVAHVEFQGKNLQSITFHPIVLNKIGQGEPELHDEHTTKLFLQTRGLPKPATGDQAGYILQRLADSSRPFGTKVVVKADVAEIDLKNGT